MTTVGKPTMLLVFFNLVLRSTESPIVFVDEGTTQSPAAFYRFTQPLENTQPPDIFSRFNQPQETFSRLTQLPETFSTSTQPPDTFSRYTKPQETFSRLTQSPETFSRFTQSQKASRYTQSQEKHSRLPQSPDVFSRFTQSPEASTFKQSSDTFSRVTTQSPHKFSRFTTESPQGFSNFSTPYPSPTISKFSSAELECFETGKVFYAPEGKCYKLLEVGPCSGEHQWLVLDKEEIVRGSGRLRAVCRECPCCDKPFGAVYWPADGQCHRKLRESEVLCPLPGTILQIDPFGEGECECKKDPPHARWDTRNSNAAACYPLYQRGPCDNGYIFVPSGNSTQCKKDPCADQNHRNSDAVFVEWEDGNNRCYKLGSKGPCQGDSSMFNIHPVVRRPACISRTNQIVELPPICDTDQSGECRKEVTLPTQTQYLNDLIMSAQKKRVKRRSRQNSLRIQKC